MEDRILRPTILQFSKQKARKKGMIKMGLFDLLRITGTINEGVERFKKTEGAVLLDVRTPEEFSHGNIPQSKNIPLNKIESIRLDKKIPLFVYCQSGGRSTQACAWLKKQGYQAENIGGISGYKGPLNRR